jgi:hypothetical protein
VSPVVVVETTAPAAPAVEVVPPAVVVEEETGDASSDDSRDSTSADGRHYHWKFIEMQKLYSEATKDNGLLEHRIEEERTARTAAEEKARALQERLVEADARVASELIFTAFLNFLSSINSSRKYSL